MGAIPGSGRSSGEGDGNPPQTSHLGNPMGGGVWQATVHEGRKRVRYDLASKQQLLETLIHKRPPKAKFPGCHVEEKQDHGDPRIGGRSNTEAGIEHREFPLPPPLS